MSEVSRTSAANRPTGAGSTKTKATQSRSRAKSGTEIADAMHTTGKSKGVPKKPEPKIITVTAGSGCSLGYLAEVHHTTVAEIMKLNPDITSPDKIREGQQIKVKHIDDKELKAYNDYQTELSNQRWEAEKAAALKKKVAAANEGIRKAKELGYGDYYDFSVNNQTGEVTITLKKDKELGDIRKGLGLPRGHLRAKNPKIMQSYSAGNIYDIDNYVRIKDWDDAEAKKGDKFVIDGDCMNPDTGFFGGRY